MLNSFSQYIQTIGRGKTAGKFLNQQQAFNAMSMVLNGETTPEQSGAFLMLLRMREESAEELAGFVQACRLHNSFSCDGISVDLDIGCYAGKRRHLAWSLLAVLVLVEQGYKVILHGHVEENSQRLYMQQVWDAFGWKISNSAESLKTNLTQRGIAYVPLCSINPELHKIINLREQFGLRSCANTLARMLNPLGARFSLHGIYHKAFEEKHVKVAQLLQEDIICIRGDAGEAEPNPERDCIVHQVVNGEYIKSTLPARLDDWQMKPKALEPSVLKSVWQGKVDDTYGKAAIIMTLALFLMQGRQLSNAQSLGLATDMWASRNREWPD